MNATDLRRLSARDATPWSGPHRRRAPSWIGAAMGIGTLIVVGAAAMVAAYWPVSLR